MTEFDDSVRLGSLRKNMSEMSDDELRALIGESRNNRVPKPKAKRVKAKADTKAKAKAKKAAPNLLSSDSLESMSPEMAAMLLKQLGDNG